MFDPTGWSAGFWLFVVIDIAAVVILGLAIAYGIRMWNTRPKDRKTEEAADAATRALYHPPRESNQETSGR